MCWKRAAGMAMNSAGVRTWRRIFDFWQARQAEVQDLISFAMLGQKKRSFTKRLVALVPGWAKPCNWRVMGRRRVSGTKGRGAGRDISHITCLAESGRFTSFRTSLVPV